MSLQANYGRWFYLAQLHPTDLESGQVTWLYALNVTAQMPLDPFCVAAS